MSPPLPLEGFLRALGWLQSGVTSTTRRRASILALMGPLGGSLLCSLMYYLRALSSILVVDTYTGHGLYCHGTDIEREPMER